MESTPHVTITVPAEWFSYRINRLIQSTEKDKEYGDSRSLMSCIYLKVDRDPNTLKSRLYMSTQSMTSTTYVTVDDVDMEGYGEFMVGAAEFRTIINNFPQDNTLIITHYNDDSDDDHEPGDIVISNDDQSMSFSMMDVPIESTNGIPKAEQKIAKKNHYVTVPVPEIRKAFRNGSSMAQKLDSDQLASQDPLSACGIYFHDEKITMFSVSNDSALFTVDAEESSMPKRGTGCIFLNIPLMNSCLSSFGDNATVTIHMEGTKTLFLSDDDTIIAINAVRYTTGRVLTSEQIFTIYNNFNVDDHAVATVQINAGTFYGALSHAPDDFASETVLDINGTRVEMKSYTNHRPVFRQVIPAEVSWKTDDERTLRIVLNPWSLRKTKNAAGDTVFMAISPQDQGARKITALIMYDPDNFDTKNPDNFFLISSAAPDKENK